MNYAYHTTAAFFTFTSILEVCLFAHEKQKPAADKQKIMCFIYIKTRFKSNLSHDNKQRSM